MDQKSVCSVVFSTFPDHATAFRQELCYDASGKNLWVEGKGCPIQYCGIETEEQCKSYKNLKNTPVESVNVYTKDQAPFGCNYGPIIELRLRQKTL